MDRRTLTESLGTWPLSHGGRIPGKQNVNTHGMKFDKERGIIEGMEEG